jgi:hypothetical protein
MELLASADEAHERLSEPATQKILQREFDEYGDGCWGRWARLSVSYTGCERAAPIATSGSCGSWRGTAAFLRPEVALQGSQQQARLVQSNTEAALQMHEGKRKLVTSLQPRRSV